MRILVTGGAGYIGSHMVLELIDAGHEVTVLDNLSTGFRSAVPDEVSLTVGDIGDEAITTALMKTRGIEAVIHFAGSIVVPDSLADPLGYYLNNTVKSRALIEAAVTSGVERFIFSSTAAVYGMPQTSPMPETSPASQTSPVPETAPLRPISPYGASKMMTEMMLADTTRAHPLRAIALRYFNVAGADPKGRTGQSTPRATHLIKVASQTALGERTHMEVFGTDYPTADGTCVRDYIHVTDLVRAHMAALDALDNGSDAGRFEVFNCGYGRGTSVLEVIEAVKRISGRDFPVRMAGRRSGDPAALVAGAERIREGLGWQPAFGDLDTIVAHALAWEKRLSGQRLAS